MRSFGELLRSLRESAFSSPRIDVFLPADSCFPECGIINKSLNLDETNGWMECECCGSAVQIMKYVKTRRIPTYQMSDAKLLVALTKK